jgi:hypothetical protein
MIGVYGGSSSEVAHLDDASRLIPDVAREKLAD